MIFSKLQVSSDELLKEPDRISEKFIESHIDKLVNDKYSWWSKPSYVLRTKRHAVAWVRNFIVTECGELNAKFVSEDKSYEVVVLSYGDRLLKFAFRLKTLGLAGYTEYSLSLKKIGEYYACTE